MNFIESVHKEMGQTCANIDKAIDWVMPIHTYLESEELPKDEVDAKWIVCLAPNYILIDGTLYKKGFSTSFLAASLSWKRPPSR